MKLGKQHPASLATFAGSVPNGDGHPLQRQNRYVQSTPYVRGGAFQVKPPVPHSAL
jgi:hypothetical protein